MRSHLVLVGALLAATSACGRPPPAASAPPASAQPAAVTTSPPPPSRAAAPAAPFYASLLEPAVSFPIQFHTSTRDCAGDTPCPPPASTPGRCASLGAPRPTARGPLVVLRCTAGDEGFDLSLVDTPEGLALVPGPAPPADAALAEMAVVVPADLAPFAPDEPSGRWAGGLEGDRYCAEDASFEGHERSLKLCFARDRGLVLYETTWVSAAGAVIERRAERP